MKKFKLLGSISVLIISIACLAFGVYSATTASFSMSGSVGFTASDKMYVTIMGTFTTYGATDFSGTAQTEKTFTLKNYSGGPGSAPAQTTFTQTAQTGNPTISDSNFNFGNITFSETGTQSLEITLDFYNDHPTECLHVLNTSDVSATGGLSATLLSEDAGLIRPGDHGTYTYQVKLTNFAKSGTSDLSNLTFDCGNPVIKEIEIYDEDEETYQIMGEEDVYYTIDTDTKEAMVYDWNYDEYEDGAVNNIPHGLKLEGDIYVVTALGSECYSPEDGCVELPNTIKTLEQEAFLDREDGIIAISIPNSVTSIGSSAFSNCSGLTTITIPSSVKSIGECAFCSCSGLTEVTIPSSVTSIGGEIFSNCSGLASITVESGNPVYHSAGNCLIETATNTLIQGCKNSIIPTDGSVTSIGDSAFAGCSGLTEVTIPSSVTSIGEYAFADCDSLTSVTFNNPTGWKAGTTPLDLTNPTQNATYLKNTHCDKTWTRT